MKIVYISWRLLISFQVKIAKAMESRENNEEFIGEPMKKRNFMNIFQPFLSFDKTQDIDQRDKVKTGKKHSQYPPQIVSLSPSEYMRQLSMTTEERIELLTNDPRPSRNQEISNVSNDFEVSPHIILFQHYTSGNIYNVTLTIRNAGKTSRYLKLTSDIDPAFTIEYKGVALSSNFRLAPGMYNSYNIRFSPEDNRDYDYTIKFATDRDILSIPILAIGPRPILDFPDVVAVPETAVKISSSKSFLVRNLGENVAIFNLFTSSPYFWIEPSKGVIEEEETVQFVVNFLSNKTGFFEDHFYLRYESGEVVRIKVQSSAIDCNVRLERGSVRMQDETYIGLSTSKSLKIFNRSEYIVKYRWMRYKDEETDQKRKKKYKQIFGLINDSEISRCMDLVHYNICMPQAHELVCQRIYADEIASLVKENFFYNNSHFSLIPMEGEIWPQSSIDVMVNFEPDEIGEISSTAYLEVTGREDRISLSLSGVSIGPVLKLNVSTIDVENIFLCSVHNYQVVCINKGLIPGVLVHRPKRSDFGGNINITPEHLKLEPGQHKSFNLSFSSNRNGDFVERVEFIVKESLQVVAMYIKGCVVCPTLHFDKSQLDFGTIALGFTADEEVTLYNDSLVPVTFSIIVPNDGTEAVVMLDDFAKAPTKTSFPLSPREFILTPNEGIVAAQSSLKIKINLTPNIARIRKTSLSVDMWDTDSVPVSLPIIFRSIVATMLVNPDNIDVRFSFINFPYTRNIVVENVSDVEGYFYLVPQTVSDSTTILYSMTTNQGYLAPRQIKTISLSIITRAMGKQQCVISMISFGDNGASACCTLICNGQGPIISVQPTILDWTNVELLQEKIMLLRLISDSPIPAQFTASVSSKHSSWKVSPTSGDLSPHQYVDLQVTIFLRDVGKHTDKIIITVTNGRTVTVALNAIGFGSCVVCDPPIFPIFDMGSMFSHQEISLPIDVTNHGSRYLKLIFSNMPEIRMVKGQMEAPPHDKFFVDPFVIELPARSNKQVFCHVRSDTCETVSEVWWLHCYVDGQGKREVVGKSTFTATFIQPSISFSKKELTFHVDMRHDRDESLNFDEFYVTNESSFSLNTHLSINSPFSIINENEAQVQSLKIILHEHKKRRIRVFFSPNAESNKKRYSKSFNGILRLEYEEHPHADRIKCLAIVHFPNIAPLPKEIRFNCPLGCSDVKNICLKNNGPFEISYKFVWIEESIFLKPELFNSVEKKKDDSFENCINEDESDKEDLSALTKDVLLSIVQNSLFTEEMEMSALESLSVEPKFVNDINKICSIVPYEAIIPPYSSHCVSFGFHAIENMSLEAKVLCEIDGGPSELMKIFGVTDLVRFDLEKDRVDFGQQMICEPNRATIKLQNLSKIDLIYHIELTDKSDESLEIRPMSATIPTQSTIELEFISRPLVPGTFDKSILLCIDHHVPISIIVEGIAVLSQVYVSLPRKNLFKDHPVEFGYQAVQSLENSLDYTNATENGWEIIVHDDTLPSIMDIEMAIERLIASHFLRDSYFFMNTRSTRDKNECPIPYLFSPEYVLDMGYVIIGETSIASIRVYNYGSRRARVCLKKPDKIDSFAKYGINIHFDNQSPLGPGEYGNLQVSFSPVQLQSSEKSSEVKKKIHLEVTNGFTLPIIIVATVTSPFVTLYPEILNFHDVLVGECMQMRLSIKNEGLINCTWEAKLPPTRRNQSDGPFSLQNGTDGYSPGQSGIIRIYFQPQKSGYVESQLTIKTHRGLEPTIVILRGRGIEHKLKIVQSSINFSSVLPYTTSEGQIFTVENTGQRPVEFYWQHLDKLALNEARLIRVLTHYYQVEEILLPVRKLLGTLPDQLYDFYDRLIDEMAQSLATQRRASSKRTNYNEDISELEDYSEEERNLVIVEGSVSSQLAKKPKISKKRKISKKLTRTGSSRIVSSEPNLSIAISSELDISEESKHLPQNDPDEIENLLHCFIDELQKAPNFRDNMKDPVQEVFDALEKKESQLEQIEISAVPKKRKICIVFHGAPSTEYQQVACKTSRILDVALLNLNNAMTEMIALGNTPCSAKLREIIDSKYRQLFAPSETSNEENNILTIDELNSLDSLTRYEYKIEMIENNLDKHRKDHPISPDTSRGGKGSARNGDKSSRSLRPDKIKAEETFLDIDLQLFTELLEQRLSMPDFSEGFVLQTLKNRFITSETKILSFLLQILGDVEYPIFITFHNPLISHQSDNTTGENNRSKSFDEISNKLMEIDEMSYSEFDILSDTDKKLYREKILRVRSQEALNKRMEFQQRMSELRKQKKKSGHREPVSQISDKESKTLTKSKNKIPKSARLSDKSIELSSRKKNETTASPKINAEKTIIKETQSVADGINAYITSLESILSIIKNWDPTQKPITTLKDTGRSKTFKISKTKDLPQTAAEKSQTEITNKFWIWHVNFNDSLNKKIFDTVVNEVAKIKEILNGSPEDFLEEFESDLRPQVYSVAMPKNVSSLMKQKPVSDEKVFDLVALKSHESDISIENVAIDETKFSDPQEESLESRIVLEPHEFRTFKVYFSPKRADFFHEEYSLGIVNSNDSTYKINFTGSGDIPHLDMKPSRIFKKIKWSKKDEMNDPTFFEDTQIFDFGSILLTSKDNKRVHRKVTSFKLWNNSKMDLELEVSLVTDDSKTFDVEPRQMIIEPDKFGILNVTAGATKFGPNEGRLVLLVKDNPRVEIIELRSNGVKLEVELEGKNITFGRVLLYREVGRNLKIRNKSTIPIFWKISPAHSVESRLTFKPEMGWTKARGETEVVFTYLANMIGIMEKQSMIFNVFLNDKDEHEEPLFTDTITATGETYDVAVDINLANPIDLGLVRVGSIAKASFNIKNRGNYEVKFVIEFDKIDQLTTVIDRNLGKNLRHDLQISPSIGNLVPEKITTINVNFQPKFEMHLREVPLLRCNLIDANNDATIVAEFPLTVSIKSRYTRFRLIPASEISFGPLEVFGNKTLQFNLENTGIFPIKYYIKNPHPSTPSVADSSRKKKTEKSPKTDLKKQATSKSQERSLNLRIGPFTLSNIEGSVEPGDMKPLTVACHPEMEGYLEEKILVSVDDCLPEDRPGKILVLNVNSCLPSIDFGDLDSIFPESYLVDDIQDFICPKEVDAHTIFSRNEKCLYFASVSIHKTHATSIKLHNRSLVPATVTVSLRPDVLTPKNAKPDTFALDTVQGHVLPMSGQIFSISFTPSLIETYTGVLEATVELPNHVKNDSHKLSIKLSGEGSVPEVCLIEPPVEKHTGKSSIRFGRCLLDEKKIQNLCFKNIGKMSARIIVGIFHDSDMIYGIRTHEDFVNSTKILKDSDAEKPYEMEQRSIIRTLAPGEVAQLVVEFRPKEIGRKEAEIHFHVLDNPYENITIELDGEGFVENVVFEDLPLFEISRSIIPEETNRMKKPQKSRGGVPSSRAGSAITVASQNVTLPSLVYKLDYGTCFVDKMNKINFKIINKSRERYFRFEFSSHPNVVFVPSIGHLQYFGSKDILANFFASEPMIHKETILECAVSEIQFLNGNRETNLWDDRETSVQWIEIDDDEDFQESFEEITSKKIVVPTREPSHEIVAGTSRTIQIMFSATVAYSEYSCTVREIHFKDTLMFQNREYTFVMENSGNVDLVFHWKIEMDSGYPTRLPENPLRSAVSKLGSFRSKNSRPSSRSSGGILYPEAEKQIYQSYSEHQRGDELYSDDENSCKPITARDKFHAFDVEPSDCSCGTTTSSEMLTDSFGRTQRSNESWIEDGEDQPFTVKPEVGLITAGQSMQFTLRFSPLDVLDYKAHLACQIENLNPNLEQPKILLTARSLLPYCHFEIEESDYLTSGRRDSRLVFPTSGSGDTNDLNEDFTNPRVVEFRVIGIGESHVKEFYLINPTTENYRFNWKDLTPRESEDLPFFHCAHEEEISQSGKRTRIVFSFLADEIGTFESFWRFSIEKYQLETIFLLVANVIEPSVHFDKSRLIMKPTILGSKVEDSLTIINEENIQLSWKILSKSLHSDEGTFQNLVVEPISGSLDPKSEQILQISVLPNHVGEFTFPLQFQVKKMKSPLSIHVTGRVSEIIPRILYSNEITPEKIFELRYDRETILDFGKLTLKRPATIKFEIANIGEIMFHYTWDLGINDSNYFLTISKEDEQVPSSSESICYLALTALRKIVIRQRLITLKIDKGPVYRMLVKGSAKHPSVEFSFINYDFGPRYVRDENSPAYVAQLLITNNDKSPAIVECMFENLPHMSIDHEALSQAILGNSTTTVAINFRPTEPLHYHEELNFDINNSTIHQVVSLKGEGILYKVCLEHVRDKFIEFGSVSVGKIVTRKIRVQNAGRAPVEVLFDLMKSLPGYDEHRRRQSFEKKNSPRFVTSTMVVSTREENDSIMSEMLSIEPHEKISISTGKIAEIIVKFEPTRRINSFVEKIGAQADSTIVPLFFVRGSCVAREFRLDRSHLYFGTVVEGCTNLTKLVLHNNGDFGGRFKWNIVKLMPNFDLKPISGYCSPGMDVTFDVVFHPTRLSPIIEAEASIEIEKYSSLKVKFSGACCKIPDPIRTLEFSVPTRSKQTKNLTVTNDSSTAWNVETTLNGEYFQAEENFVVPAKKSYSCRLIYSPLVMNTEKNLHQGRLVVKLPEGNPPLVYSLVGLSLPPEVAGKIVRQLPAKTKYTELLPVHNWTKKSRSFHCDIKLIDNPEVNSVQYNFTGNSRLDVPANGTRDYRGLFYCYREAILNFRITFTNEAGEYEFYEIQYKVTKPDILSTIKLTSPARSSISHYLEIDNPLEDQSVTFTVNCQHRDITIRDVPKIITAKSNDKIIIEYSPLTPGESVATLDVTCPELGTFPYELKLKATSPPLEKVTRVTAMLGSSTKFPIVVKNIGKKTSEFKIEVDDPSFTCDQSISVASQKETILQVTYEPCDAKNVKAMLRATSESLGEMCFPLIGSYTLPKPQGPFTILQNSSINIAFKNVFQITKTFAYVLEGSNTFSVSTSSIILKPKESATLSVKFSLQNNSTDGDRKYPVTGKLVISAIEPTSSQVDWIYYLRGVEE